MIIKWFTYLKSRGKIEQGSWFNFLFKLDYVLKPVYYLSYMLYAWWILNSDIGNPILQEDKFELIVIRSYIYGRSCTLVRLYVYLLMGFQFPF